MIAEQDHLAITYNDSSVLENHHCAVTFRILKDPRTNIFANLSPSQFQQLRKIIIGCILHTDMSLHFEILAKFNHVLETGSSVFFFTLNTPVDLNSNQYYMEEAERTILMQSLLHSADISNPCKPWKMSLHWANAILEEFFHQVGHNLTFTESSRVIWRKLKA